MKYLNVIIVCMKIIKECDEANKYLDAYKIKLEEELRILNEQREKEEKNGKR